MATKKKKKNHEKILNDITNAFRKKFDTNFIKYVVQYTKYDCQKSYRILKTLTEKPKSNFPFIDKLKQGHKVLIIVRGLPGSGKTFLAKSLIDSLSNDELRYENHIFSSDDYFKESKMELVYDLELNQKAVEWNLERVNSGMVSGLSPVIIDDINLEMSDMKPFAIKAIEYGYLIEIIEPRTEWSFKLKKLFRKTSRNIPRDIFKEMLNNYQQNIIPAQLLDFYDLKYKKVAPLQLRAIPRMTSESSNEFVEEVFRENGADNFNEIHKNLEEIPNSMMLPSVSFLEEGEVQAWKAPKNLQFGDLKTSEIYNGFWSVNDNRVDNGCKTNKSKLFKLFPQVTDTLILDMFSQNKCDYDKTELDLMSLLYQDDMNSTDISVESKNTPDVTSAPNKNTTEKESTVKIYRDALKTKPMNLKAHCQILQNSGFEVPPQQCEKAHQKMKEPNKISRNKIQYDIPTKRANLKRKKNKEKIMSDIINTFQKHFDNTEVIQDVVLSTSYDFQKSFSILKEMIQTNQKASLENLSILEKIKNDHKVLIIVRGLPGSGKTFLAKSLIDSLSNDELRYEDHIFSSDDYFKESKMELVYDLELNQKAVEWNLERVNSVMVSGLSPVIIDDINLEMSDMKPFAIKAIEYGYSLEIIEPKTEWSFKLKKLFRKTSRNIPRDIFKEMLNNYHQKIIPAQLFDFYDLKYKKVAPLQLRAIPRMTSESSNEFVEEVFRENGANNSNETHKNLEEISNSTTSSSVEEHLQLSVNLETSGKLFEEFFSANSANNSNENSEETSNSTIYYSSDNFWYEYDDDISVFSFGYHEFSDISSNYSQDNLYEEEFVQDIKEENYIKNLASAKSFRSEAKHKFSNAKELYEKAQYYHQKKMYSAARYYFNEAHKQKSQMHEANNLAADSFMASHSERLQQSNTIDLHGLHVKEALNRLENFINDKLINCTENTECIIITGKGNRSKKGKPKILPQVKNYLEDKKIPFLNINGGSFKIWISGELEFD